MPELVGVKEAEQLDTVEFTLTNVQGAPEKLPVAEPELLNDTVPPGADAVPLAVSLTKAVQVVAWETTIEEGEQDTTIEVDLPPTVTVLLAVGPLPL